jgi:ADP-ribosylglycohydrolase
LAHYIHKATDQIKRLPHWQAFMDWLDAELGWMSPVHTINNALICIMSIYYGRMDPDESISIAVMAGLDTDCNGATVGSITGAASGRRGFGPVYAPQLHDRIEPQVFGFQGITMEELARRCLRVWDNMDTVK